MTPDPTQRPDIPSTAVDQPWMRPVSRRTTGEIAPRAFLISGGLSLMSVAILMRITGLSVVASPHSMMALAAAGFVGPWPLGIGSRKRQEPSRAATFVEYVFLLALISLLGTIATYPIASLSRDFCDALLMRADRVLGFDWVQFYDVVAAHRSVQVVERAFYDSVFVTPLVLSAYFAHYRQRSRAHLFIASYWLAVMMTLVLFAFFPAKGPVALSWHGVLPYIPNNGIEQAAIIEGLKQHRIHEVPLDALRGIVSLPSFHTAAAVLYMIAAWPIQRLRWPVLLVNLAMLVSIPVEGTHYLTDMVAGAFVAISAQGAMSLLLHASNGVRSGSEKASF